MPAKINDELRDQLRKIPQKFIREACGHRQVVHLQKMETRWGCPLSGATVDLYSLLDWLWTFLVKHGPTLKAVLETSDAASEGPLAVKLVKARIAKLQADARMAELRLVQKEGRLVDLEQVHSLLELVANRVNKTSDRAQKKWGSEGFEFFNDLANGIESDIRVLIERDDEQVGEAKSTDDA